MSMFLNDDDYIPTPGVAVRAERGIKLLHLMVAVSQMQNSEINSDEGRKVFEESYEQATVLLKEAYDAQQEYIKLRGKL